MKKSVRYEVQAYEWHITDPYAPDWCWRRTKNTLRDARKALNAIRREPHKQWQTQFRIVRVTREVVK